MKLRPPRRRSAALAIACAFVLAPTLAAWAGTTGLVARASSATSTGLQAQPSLVSLPNGSTADLAAMTSWVAAHVIDDRAIVIHDIGTGATFEALPGTESVGVISFEGGASQTLGEMIDEPGAMVFFESPAVSPPDPAHAERFEVIYAQSGSTTYIARPVFMLQAPEPGAGAMWAAGAGCVALLARRRSARNRA